MSKKTKVEIGTPATIYVGSDKYAAKVVAVSPSGKTITLQRGKDVFDPERARQDSEGRWRIYGGNVRWFVELGRAIDYRDPEF